MNITYTREDIYNMFKEIQRVINMASHSGLFTDPEIIDLRWKLLDAMNYELMDTAQNYEDCVVWCIILEPKF